MKEEIKVTREELKDIWNHALKNGYTSGYIDGNTADEFLCETEPLPSYIEKLFKDDDSRK